MKKFPAALCLVLVLAPAVTSGAQERVSVTDTVAALVAERDAARIAGDTQLAAEKSLAIRVAKAQALADAGTPAPQAASVSGRTVSITHSRAPWVDARGNLNVRVRAAENGLARGIGASKVRDEHIVFVDPPFRVATGATQLVDDGRGGQVAEPVFAENPAAALDQIVLQVIRAIGVSDAVLRARGDTTYQIYPAAGTGPTGTTADGVVWRSVTNEAWATIRGGAGTTAWAENNSTLYCYIFSGDTTGNYDQIHRPILSFDTSVVGMDEIATLSFSTYGKTKSTALGASRLVVHAATPAAVDDFVIADYAVANFGSTEFGSVSSAAFTTSDFNVISLNAAGIAHINTSGVTVFGLRLGFDFDNVAPTWANSVRTEMSTWSADHATNDPSLIIELAGGAASPGAQVGAPF